MGVRDGLRGLWCSRSQRSAGENKNLSEGQTGRNFSNVLEQLNVASERGLLFRGRHLLKNVVKDTDEGQPGREGDPNRVRLEVGEEEVDGVDFGRTLGVKVIIKTGVLLEYSLEGGVAEKHPHQRRRRCLVCHTMADDVELGYVSKTNGPKKRAHKLLGKYTLTGTSYFRLTVIGVVVKTSLTVRANSRRPSPEAMFET